nr:HK97 gp10 family phage protein [Clostridia bacterium]
MAKVTFRDYSDVVLRRMQGALGDASSRVVEIAVESVQEKMLYGYHDVHGDPPHTEIVDTGRLFDSIEGQVKRSSSNTYTVEVGTNVEYAKYVHEGTYKLKGRPFITDGLTAAKGDIEKAIADIIRQSMK